mmetsp:Transcript_21963/g.32442  ORF Transcript_21963/g.32442 Transcript_21963/m.32442 type:complete len:373 (+) Transcript_21963:232-1350(+)|eukprot:CAMPEP_0194217778 /NCGR_PEP_ID=MMETSP0156-20130528/22246_1 /TAXON_ID=33649 /ORGANISM="Thalassionema nitzschioides, Strain L26-B" /LENGTH=372 /DNA_ID=CAMNT_0038946913 /DNA_START=164 /DNA_END=1282 /DNA_ORIENTATION=-
MANQGMIRNRQPHSRQPTRLILIINFLGIVNLVGMTAILFSEHPKPEVTGHFSGAIQYPKGRKSYSNNKGGINETIQKLKQLGIHHVSSAEYLRLPPWALIENQYGSNPIILGLDQCHEFRQMNVKKATLVAPAGLFNSGTNLLADLLDLNCKTRSGKISIFQPPWGKHTPREFRDEHIIPHHPYTSIQQSTVLPVVLLRHPFDWMKSMCRRPYAVYWPFNGRNDPSFVCPSIVKDHNMTQKIFVSFGSGNQTFESIVHLWNVWNRGWYNSLAFPRLVIRMEDLLFHADRVVGEICNCVGATMTENFQVPLRSSKSNQLGHFNHNTTFLQEFIRHGNLQSWNRFPRRDVVAARALLDKELLQTFNYQLPTDT